MSRRFTRRTSTVGKHVAVPKHLGERTPPWRRGSAAPGVRVPPVVHALGVGVFAVGMSEFMIAGLLPEIAADVDVSVSAAGFLVSAFAVGMCVGAPVMTALTLRASPRLVLTGALAVVAAGHVLGACATSYQVLLVSRVVSATATGAFWAVAAVVAVANSPAEIRGRSLAAMVGGLTVANVVGVPAGAFLGDHLGWRSPFWVVAALAAAALVGVAGSVPRGRPAQPTPSLAGELRAFRCPRLWVALGTTAVYQAAMICAITYLGPLVIDGKGLDGGVLPLVFCALGLGSVAGTFIGGRLGDRYPWRTLLVGLGSLVVVLGLLGATGGRPEVVLALGFAAGTAGYALSTPLNTRIFALAGSAPTLASASNVSAFNLGATVGPWLGGVAISVGLGVTAPPWLAAALVAGALCLALFGRHLDSTLARPA
jgi:DHA1 family chloramphenicol resistance protein-like MFS transporter